MSIQSIISIDSRQNILKEIRILLFHSYNLTDLTLAHVFHANIIAYCQQNWYLQLAIYTDLFTLI